MDTSLVDLVQQGGWPSLAIAAIAVLSIPTCLALPVIAWAVGRPRVAGGLAIGPAALAALAIGLGGAGFAMGVRAAEAAVGMAPPDMRELLLLAGRAEARTCLALGLATAALPLLAAAITAARAVTARPSWLAGLGGAVLGVGLAMVAGGLARQQYDVSRAQRALANVAPEQRPALAEMARIDPLGSSVLTGAVLAAVGGAMLAGARRRQDTAGLAGPASGGAA
jgi:hypothetical protein